jgi:hypothetical protein
VIIHKIDLSKQSIYIEDGSIEGLINLNCISLAVVYEEEIMSQVRTVFNGFDLLCEDINSTEIKLVINGMRNVEKKI